MDAAFLEGKIEKAKFRVVAAAKDHTGLLLLKTKGNQAAPLIKREAGQGIAIPNSPPVKTSASISHVTWRKMSALVAPNAPRVPISRGRSLTVNQEIAIHSKPETASTLAAIHHKKKPSLLAAAICVSSKLFWL